MNCTQCNTPVTGAFCSECGAPAPADASAEASATATPATATPAQPTAGSATQPVAPAPYGTPPSPQGAPAPFGAAPNNGAASPYGAPPAGSGTSSPYGAPPAPGGMPVQPAYGGYPVAVAAPPKKRGKVVAIVLVCVAIAVALLVFFLVSVLRLATGSFSLPTSPVTYSQFYTAAEANGFDVYDLTDPDDEVSYLLAEAYGGGEVHLFECFSEMEAVGVYSYLESTYGDIANRYRTSTGTSAALYSGKNGSSYMAVLRVDSTILVVEADAGDIAQINALLTRIGLENLLVE